jgi:hypothetical protein
LAAALLFFIAALAHELADGHSKAARSPKAYDLAIQDYFVAQYMGYLLEFGNLN